MKAISVYDLQRIPELNHLSIYDLVHPDNDYLVNPFLYTLGMDTDYGLHYTVSQHRTLANEVKVGFVIRGDIRYDREFLTGPFATVEDRLIAAAYTDPSLCAELCKKLNTSLNYAAFHEGGVDEGQPHEDFPDSLCNDDEDEVAALIASLKDVLFHIRGDQRREDGSLKTPADYQAKNEVVVKKKVRRKKVVA